SAGLPDDSYLYINYPEILERIRFEDRAAILQTYPRHILVENGTEYGAGQPMVTPDSIKGLLINKYKSYVKKGWVQNIEGFIERLVVEINEDNPTRVDYQSEPFLATPFVMSAGKLLFHIGPD